MLMLLETFHQVGYFFEVFRERLYVMVSMFGAFGFNRLLETPGEIAQTIEMQVGRCCP